MGTPYFSLTRERQLAQASPQNEQFCRRVVAAALFLLLERMSVARYTQFRSKIITFIFFVFSRSKSSQNIEFCIDARTRQTQNIEIVQ